MDIPSFFTFAKKISLFSLTINRYAIKGYFMSNKFIETEKLGNVAVIRLNRPEKLNAWHGAMREEIMQALKSFDHDDSVRALIMTGAGNRAFSAGQDLEEAQNFDVSDSAVWIQSWERFYDVLRNLQKPLVMALNGTAAGSAFQVTLLGDIRVAHAGVKMGQPEINSGIASVTGPWIMNLMLGMSRTIELTLTGRMMEAEESHRIGLIHHLVAEEQVFAKALEIAQELGAKPPVAMRLNKQRFKEMSTASFADTLEAATRLHAESYASGEPVRMMEEFFKVRRERKVAH